MSTSPKQFRLKTTELPKPLYAAAGAGELAYQQLRKLPGAAARTLRTAGQTAGELRQRFATQDEPVATRMRASAERGRTAMRATATAAQQRATTGYRNLVARGERMVAERAEAEQSRSGPMEVVVGPVEPEQPRSESGGAPGEGPSANGDQRTN